MGDFEFAWVYEKVTQLKKKRRILFLFAHLHKGGMQRAVSNISLALPDNFEQYVGYFGTEDPGFQYKAKMHDFGLSGSGQNGIVRKASNAWNRLRAIRAFVVQNEIDAVVSFGEGANIYSILSGHGARTIISSRVALKESLAKSDLYALLYQMLVKWTYPRTDMLVAVSELLGHNMRRIVSDKDKVTVIPNLYHVDEIRALAKEVLPPETAFLEKKRFILNVGSLCYQKGQDDLLTIFSGVVQRGYDDVLLIIMGRGEWKGKLQEQARVLGISDRVVFVDFDTNPYRYMARASVFVLTSRFEGFPNVLAEAMICGAPVVAFDCPTGPKEILGDSKYGVLVGERSIRRAAEAICKLIEDDTLNLEFRELGAGRAMRYSADHVIKQWVKLLA